MPSENGSAHAGGAAVFDVVELVRIAQHGEDLRAHGLGLARGLFPAFIQASQHNHEFVAAYPGDRVALPDARGETLRDVLQQQVALVVAQGVVESLEKVPVNKTKEH